MAKRRSPRQINKFRKKTRVLADITDRNHELQKKVEERTAELQAEIAERKSTEEQLRASEKKMNRTQEMALLGSWELDVVANRLSWSDQVYRIFGLCPQEFGATYEAFLDVVYPDDRAAVDEAYSGSLREGRDVYEIEHRVVRKSDGKIRIVHEKCEHLRDSSGRIVQSIGMVHDITERKQVEDELRKSRTELERRVEERTGELTEALAALKQSEARYKDLYDQANDIIFTTDLEGRITSANAKAMELFSRGLTVAGIPSLQHILTTESYGRVAALLARAVTQNSDLSDEQPWEFEARTQDGNAVLLEVKARLIRESGTITGIQGIARDITQRKKLEEERAKLSSAVERAGEGIFMLTPDKRYSYINTAFCKTSGFTHEELVGKSTTITRSDRHDQSFHDSIWKQLQAGEMWSGRQTRKRKDGSPVAVETTIAPIRDASGTIVHYVGVERDITAQLQMEEQLRQSHKMEAIGTLAGGIAHDFNNMLAVIIGNAELALDDTQEEAFRGNLKQILQASKRSRDLVKQILTFSRRSVGQEKAVKMAPLVKETYELLRASLPSTITMNLNMRKKSDIILADPSHVQQVLVNLANNAAYAMREDGGMLTIGLSSITLGPDSLPDKSLKPGRYVKLTVKDTGTGIAAGVQRRMFEPFFTTKEHGQGTGMGLSVVYGIVKSYDGMIEVESEVGKGSTFTVLLPQTDGFSTIEEEEEQSPACSGKEHVLFVDDEPAVVEMTKAVLEKVGCRVTAFTNAPEALKAFTANSHTFDLIITDQTMPGMTGLGLAKEILAVRKDMPIILCTGYSEVVSPEKAREVGIREFVMKPVTRKEMAQAILRVLERGEDAE